MKKIGVVTFHSPYNYGSSFQAYALQETVKNICDQNCEYKIINLRTERQKYMYSIDRDNNLLSKITRNIIMRDYKKSYEIKNQKFEDFINNKLNVTKEYNSIEELEKENFDFDYYISGSDQLWNLRAYDFDWAYYLGFIKNGKKISYAASFGPKPIDFSEEEKEKIKKYINDYKCLSVREQGSYDNIYNLTGRKPEIHMDPTILLGKNDWENIIPKEKMVNGEYILYYSLGQAKDDINLVKEISRKTNMPVVTTRYAGKNATQLQSITKVLDKMKDYQNIEDRTCKFVTVLTAILPNGEKIVTRGECKGYVAKSMGKLGGLTYIPIFIPKGFDKPLSNLDKETFESTHNHRDLAVKKLLEEFRKRDIY